MADGENGPSMGPAQFAGMSFEVEIGGKIFEAVWTLKALRQITEKVGTPRRILDQAAEGTIEIDTLAVVVAEILNATPQNADAGAKFSVDEVAESLFPMGFLPALNLFRPVLLRHCYGPELAEKLEGAAGKATAE